MQTGNMILNQMNNNALTNTPKRCPMNEIEKLKAFSEANGWTSEHLTTMARCIDLELNLKQFQEAAPADIEINSSGNKCDMSCIVPHAPWPACLGELTLCPIKRTQAPITSSTSISDSVIISGD